VLRDAMFWPESRWIPWPTEPDILRASSSDIFDGLASPSCSPCPNKEPNQDEMDA
jgi:hypothetical protein